MMKAKNVHIIGVGGIGTSAVAKFWIARGAKVSGTDVHSSQIIQDLEKYGVDVRIGHFVDNVPRDCDLVVYSRAVPATNVERQVVAERGIIEMSYAEFLGELAKDYKTIAVSGTHGKSTTTSMIANILIDAGLDPTVIVGTKVPGFVDGNLRVGEGEWLVLEACEHMASMLNIEPDIAVVTNIEEDHLDYYKDIDHIRDTFQEWINSAGTVVLNSKDEESKKLAAKEIFTFDISERSSGDGKQNFRVLSSKFKDEKIYIDLRIPGEYNAMNAGAASLVGSIVGVENNQIKNSLEKFNGTWRRFEHVGAWHGAEVYSEYAHHPSAILGSLKAYREFFPGYRIVLCYEPHQHSRTRELFDDFVQAFDEADALVMAEIYGVEGRTEDESVSSLDLVEKIKDRGNIETVEYAKDYVEAESKLRDIVKPGGVLIIMGAGTIDNLARKLAS